MVLKIKKLNEKAKIPCYANPGDAGLDLFSCESITINPGDRVLVGTGISVELPEGTEGQLRPRSGLAIKRGITLINSPGTLDACYRGEVKLAIINHGKDPFVINEGDKIAQMVISKFESVSVQECNELSNTQRGVGGFGSTGV